MPQLNPSPWLLTFITVWFLLILLLTPKLLSTMPLKPPLTPPHPMNTPPWAWPWY